MAAATAHGLTLGVFAVILAVTLAITYWAARRTRDASGFWAANRGVSGAQNGLAIAGDYMSAAAFLGTVGLIYFFGFDGFITGVAALASFVTVLLLLAERMRNAGKYTMADVLAFRLNARPARTAAAIGTLFVVGFYLVAQMIAAGALFEALAGITFPVAVVVTGLFMLVYVLFGGMIATTWVQIIKAILLLFGVTLLTLLVLSRFHFSPGELYGAVAAQYGQAALEPGGLVTDPVDAVSLGLALMFGLLGLPHILMRFYTVPDARAARTSVLYATGFVGYFYLIIPIVGFGASALVGREIIRKVDSGGNMAAPLVAELLGGTPFLGFIAAVAFATILAVVAGLTLAGASALSHDIFMHAIRKGQASEREQIRVARAATVVFGVVAVVLGILFKGQNVAFMVGLAFAVAASANFPALLMSIVWRGFNTAGAVCSIVVGALLSVVLIVLSPTIWVDLLHNTAAIFPLRNPAIVSMSAGFLAGVVASLLVREPGAEAMFDEEKLRTYLGVGAE